MGRAAISAVVIAALPVSAADAVDGGMWWNDPLYVECPKAPPPAQQADGSWVLPPERAARNACLMEACDARRRQLEPLAEGPPVLSTAGLVMSLTMLAIGMFGGAYLGWELRALFGR